MAASLVGRLFTHCSSDVGLTMVGASGISSADSLSVPSDSAKERRQWEHEVAPGGFDDWQAGQIIGCCRGLDIGSFPMRL